MGILAFCYVGANWKENRGRYCCCIMFRMYFSSEFFLLVAVKNVSWMSVSISRLFRKLLIR